MLLMEELLHHLGCIKPCKQWDELPMNWCRIWVINSMTRCDWEVLKGSQGARGQGWYISQVGSEGSPKFSKKPPTSWPSNLKKSNHTTPKWYEMYTENVSKTPTWHENITNSDAQFSTPYLLQVRKLPNQLDFKGATVYLGLRAPNPGKLLMG